MQELDKTIQILKLSYKDVNSYIESMKIMFDVVRLVDAEECREISISQDGNICFGSECYAVWKADHRCANCTSYKSCHTHKKKNRIEYFNGKCFNITSVPVELTLTDSSVYFCSMELISATVDAQNKKYEEKAYRETSEYISTHDTLTGLLNWDGFCKKARKLISNDQDKQFLMITFSIDNYMFINSLYGNAKSNDVFYSFHRHI